MATLRRVDCQKNETAPTEERSSAKCRRLCQTGSGVSGARHGTGGTQTTRAFSSYKHKKCGASAEAPSPEAVEAFRITVYRRLRAARVAVSPGWGRMLAYAYYNRCDLTEDDVVDVIRRRASELGLETGVVARAAGAYPAILQQETAILRLRLEHLTVLLSGDAEYARRVAGREPRLLLQREKRTAANFLRLGIGLSVGTSALQSLVRRWPGVLAQCPQTVIGRLYYRLAEVLGLEESDLRKAVVAQPKLLGVTSARLAANAATLAQGLGADPQQMRRVIRWMPQTLYQCPETVLRRMDEMALLLSVDRGSMRHLALRQPALLLRRPQSVAERGIWIRRLGRVCGETGDLAALIGRLPNALNFSMRTLRMRYILACLRAGRMSYRGVLMLASDRAEAALAAELCGRLGREEAMRRLHRLATCGLLEGEVGALLEAVGICPHRPRLSAARPRSPGSDRRASRRAVAETAHHRAGQPRHGTGARGE
jgi:hypothetical protein